MNGANTPSPATLNRAVEYEDAENMEAIEASQRQRRSGGRSGGRSGRSGRSQTLQTRGARSRVTNGDADMSQVTQVFLPERRRRYPTTDLKRLMKQKVTAEARANAAEAELVALRASRNRLLADRACGGCREQRLLSDMNDNRKLSALCDRAIARNLNKGQSPSRLSSQVARRAANGLTGNNWTGTPTATGGFVNQVNNLGVSGRVNNLGTTSTAPTGTKTGTKTGTNQRINTPTTNTPVVPATPSTTEQLPEQYGTGMNMYDPELSSGQIGQTSLGVDQGYGTGLGVDQGYGTGLGVDQGYGTGMGMGQGYGTGMGMDQGYGTGMGMDQGYGTGMGMGQDYGGMQQYGTGMGMDQGYGTGMGMGQDYGGMQQYGTGMGMDQGYGTGMGMGQDYGGMQQYGGGMGMGQDYGGMQQYGGGMGMSQDYGGDMGMSQDYGGMQNYGGGGGGFQNYGGQNYVSGGRPSQLLPNRPNRINNYQPGRTSPVIEQPEIDEQPDLPTPVPFSNSPQMTGTKPSSPTPAAPAATGSSQQRLWERVYGMRYRNGLTLTNVKRVHDRKMTEAKDDAAKQRLRNALKNASANERLRGGASATARLSWEKAYGVTYRPGMTLKDVEKIHQGKMQQAKDDAEKQRYRNAWKNAQRNKRLAGTGQQTPQGELWERVLRMKYRDGLTFANVKAEHDKQLAAAKDDKTKRRLQSALDSAKANKRLPGRPGASAAPPTSSMAPASSSMAPASSAPVDWKALLGYQQGDTLKTLLKKFNQKMKAAKTKEERAALNKAWELARKELQAGGQTGQQQQQQNTSKPLWQRLFKYVPNDTLETVRAKYQQALKSAQGVQDREKRDRQIRAVELAWKDAQNFFKSAANKITSGVKPPEKVQPSGKVDWKQLLEYKQTNTLKNLEGRYAQKRTAAKTAKANSTVIARLNAAIQQARRELRGGVGSVDPAKLLPGKTLAEVQKAYDSQVQKARAKGRQNVVAALNKALVVRKRQLASAAANKITSGVKPPEKVQPSGKVDWKQLLEYKQTNTLKNLEGRYAQKRTAAKTAKANSTVIARLNTAIQQARRELRGGVASVPADKLLPGKTLAEVQKVYESKKARAKGRQNVVAALNKALAERKKQLSGIVGTGSPSASASGAKEPGWKRSVKIDYGTDWRRYFANSTISKATATARAGKKDIDSVYRKRTLEMHPDKHPGANQALATQAFQKLQKYKGLANAHFAKQGPAGTTGTMGTTGTTGAVNWKVVLGYREGDTPLIVRKKFNQKMKAAKTKEERAVLTRAWEVARAQLKEANSFNRKDRLGKPSWQRLFGYKASNTVNTVRPRYQKALKGAQGIKDQKRRDNQVKEVERLWRNAQVFLAKKPPPAKPGKQTGKPLALTAGTAKPNKQAKQTAAKQMTAQAKPLALTAGTAKPNKQAKPLALTAGTAKPNKQAKQTAAKQMTAQQTAAKQMTAQAKQAAAAKKLAVSVRKKRLAALPWQMVLGYKPGMTLKQVRASYDAAIAKAGKEGDTAMRDRLRKALSEAKRDRVLKEVEKMRAMRPEKLLAVRKGVNTKITVGQRYYQSRQKAMASRRPNVVEILNAAWKKVEPGLPATANARQQQTAKPSSGGGLLSGAGGGKGQQAQGPKRGSGRPQRLGGGLMAAGALRAARRPMPMAGAGRVGVRVR